MSIDEYKAIGTHWKKSDSETYFCRFVVGHIPREIKKFIGNKKIKTNIFRIQVHNKVCILLYYIYCFCIER